MTIYDTQVLFILESSNFIQDYQKLHSKNSLLSGTVDCLMFLWTCAHGTQDVNTHLRNW